MPGIANLTGVSRPVDCSPSNVAQVYPFQVLLSAEQTGLRVDAKAQAEQIRSVSVERVGTVIGRVPAHQMTDRQPMAWRGAGPREMSWAQHRRC